MERLRQESHSCDQFQRPLESDAFFSPHFHRVRSHALFLQDDDELVDEGLIVPRQINLWDGSPDMAYSIGFHSIQGASTKMEDRVVVADLSSHPHFMGCRRAVLMAVLDGHAGCDAVNHLEQRLLPLLLDEVARQLGLPLAPHPGPGTQPGGEPSEQRLGPAPPSGVMAAARAFAEALQADAGAGGAAPGAANGNGAASSNGNGNGHHHHFREDEGAHADAADPHALQGRRAPGAVVPPSPFTCVPTAHPQPHPEGTSGSISSHASHSPAQPPLRTPAMAIPGAAAAAARGGGSGSGLPRGSGMRPGPQRDGGGSSGGSSGACHSLHRHSSSDLPAHGGAPAPARAGGSGEGEGAATGCCPPSPHAALRAALLQCEAELMELECASGSTALLALLLGGDLWLANVGDCRAVVSDDAEARQLTRDHKASGNANPQELQRLEAAGAQLTSDGYLQVTHADGSCQDLAVTRNLGCAHIKRKVPGGSTSGLASVCESGSAGGGPASQSVSAAGSVGAGLDELAQLQQVYQQMALQGHQQGPCQLQGGMQVPAAVALASGGGSSHALQVGGGGWQQYGAAGSAARAGGGGSSGGTAPQQQHLAEDARQVPVGAAAAPLPPLALADAGAAAEAGRGGSITQGPPTPTLAPTPTGGGSGGSFSGAQPLGLPPRPAAARRKSSEMPPAAVRLGLGLGAGTLGSPTAAPPAAAAGASGDPTTPTFSRGSLGSAFPTAGAPHAPATAPRVPASGPGGARPEAVANLAPLHVLQPLYALPLYGGPPLAPFSDAAGMLEPLAESDSGTGTAGVLIPDPELFHYSVTQDSEFLVLACDGLWDVMRNGEAVRMVRRTLADGRGPQVAAEQLVQCALKVGSRDNISAVVLRFSSRPLALASSASVLRLRKLASEAGMA